MVASLKIYFLLLLLNWKARTWNLVWSIRVTCRSKIAKIAPIEIQNVRHGSHLEKLFLASSPEPKGQLTWNLVGIIRVTCRSKTAKIILIGYTRWLPWWPSWKSFRFSRKKNKVILMRNPRWPPWWPFWKGQWTWTWVGSFGVTCRSKIAEIVPIGNPKWPLFFSSSPAPYDISNLWTT